jgi:hypothetical protein
MNSFSWYLLCQLPFVIGLMRLFVRRNRGRCLNSFPSSFLHHLYILIRLSYLLIKDIEIDKVIPSLSIFLSFTHFNWLILSFWSPKLRQLNQVLHFRTSFFNMMPILIISYEITGNARGMKLIRFLLNSWGHFTAWGQLFPNSPMRSDGYYFRICEEPK